MDVSRWIDESRAAVDSWILEDLDETMSEKGSVEEAMRYSLLAGGKRLRPQLVLASGEYLHIDRERLRPAALAVEYLHTYSLIHDDLPSMDNDDLRRGVPTSHKVFGEAIAILAGDALLTEAFAQMMELMECGFSATGVVEATKRLAGSAGRSGLIQGQVLDLAAEHQEITVQSLENIHRHKTAALIEACLAIPALLVRDPDAERVLSGFGRHCGLAFQMVDDILNVVGDVARLGKATGTDAGLGKATYPRLVGMDEAKSLVVQHRRLALAELDTVRAEVLVGLLQFAVERSW